MNYSAYCLHVTGKKESLDYYLPRIKTRLEELIEENEIPRYEPSEGFDRVSDTYATYSFRTGEGYCNSLITRHRLLDVEFDAPELPFCFLTWNDESRHYTNRGISLPDARLQAELGEPYYEEPIQPRDFVEAVVRFYEVLGRPFPDREERGG